NTALVAAVRDSSPKVGTIDAEHQAVLREISDVENQILRTQLTQGAPPDLGPTAPPADPDECRSAMTHGDFTTTTLDPGTWCSQYKFLDDTRLQLEALEHKLNQQLNAEIAAQGPDAGTLDAKHQAVLRELSDIQEQILRLVQSKPPATT